MPELFQNLFQYQEVVLGHNCSYQLESTVQQMIVHFLPQEEQLVFLRKKYGMNFNSGGFISSSFNPSNYNVRSFILDFFYSYSFNSNSLNSNSLDSNSLNSNSLNSNCLNSNSLNSNSLNLNNGNSNNFNSNNFNSNSFNSKLFHKPNLLKQLYFTDFISNNKTLKFQNSVDPPLTISIQ